MTLAEFLDQYGYAAVLLGTFFEGETILVMGGFAAHQGYLELPVVMLAAFGGSLAGDQVAFFLGRRHAHLLDRFPRLQKSLGRARRLLRERGTLLLIGFRFVYGIRNVTPFAAGIAHVRPSRFLVLNTLGAAVWAVTVAAAGYAFGEAFVLVLARARHFEEQALILLAVVGLVAASAYWWSRIRRRPP